MFRKVEDNNKIDFNKYELIISLSIHLVLLLQHVTNFQ